MKTRTLKKYKKVYSTGGAFKPNDALTSGAGLAASLSGPLVDMFAPANKYGRQSGVATGIKQGATFAAEGAKIGGPLGAAIGGVAGLGMGLIGSVAAKKAEDALDRKEILTDEQFSLNAGAAKIAGDPSLLYGNKNNQMFKTGGPLTGLPLTAPKAGTVSPEGRSFWNGFVDHVATKGYKGSPDLDKKDTNLSRKLFDEYAQGKDYSYDEFVPAVQSNINQYRNTAIQQVKSGAAKWDGYKHDENFDGFMPGLSGVDGWAGSKTTSWKFPDEVVAGTNKPNTVYKKAMGGPLQEAYQNKQSSLEPLNHQAVEVQGPSHENGGVQIPGAEVEGGETISKGFVFSEELGFSKLHKPIAKAMGKLELKPLTSVRKNTMEALKKREEELAIAQETFKQQAGIE